MKSFLPNTHKKNLLLIGGGHSHITVIKQLGMKSSPDVKITLVSENTYTPYSGMLPGLIAGHYQFDDCHIDLRKLCQWAGVRFICGTVNRLDPKEKKIFCDQHPSLHYDLISINTGSQPQLSTIQNGLKYGHPIKPIKKFLHQWQYWVNSLTENNHVYHIVVVGAGAAGIEVLLAMHHHIQNTARIHATFTLINSERSILPTHNEKTQFFFKQHLKKLNIKVINELRATAIAKQQLTLQNDQTLDADFIAWTIDAGAQAWPAESGLQCDSKGFILVDQFLRSISHADIFAAGDTAAFKTAPLPKAGVYAVRQGPVLSNNLIAALKNKSMRPYVPQQHFLSLLTTGTKYAVASRGNFFAKGKWVWHWKNYIDRKFMARFNPKPMPIKDSKQDDTQKQMRCGGCGAKINSRILHNVLDQLVIKPNPDIISSLADDAAIINQPKNTQWVQSVDFFRQFIDDPYLFGQIVAIHGLGDIHAMGARPHSALVTAIIPFGPAVIMEETLRHIMLGILVSLDYEKTVLIGGHTGEGNELSAGLTVNGTLGTDHALTKQGFRHGDRLILTKPIGTGILLAANMAAYCQGRWLDNTFNYMLQSHLASANIIRKNNAHGCTDITGFGLLGHLQEILAMSKCGATLNLDKIPTLDGAIQCSAKGIKSTLYNANKQACLQLNYAGQNPVFPLLFDPQTSGGLLAGIPQRDTDQCLSELDAAGYTAANIGWIDKQLPVGSIILED